MRLGKLFARSVFYFRLGFGNYVGFIFSGLTFASTTYYLVIQTIPEFTNIFPNFGVYLMVLSLVGFPLSVGIGWMHFKGNFKVLFRAEQDIQYESSPYTTVKIPKVTIPQYELFLKMAETMGYIDIAKELKTIIDNSKKESK